jgi:hypothetical protein
MTTLVIGKSENFAGEVPVLPAERLPAGAATYAVNCDFAHGELRSLRGLGEIHPVAPEAMPVRSVFTPDGLGFFAWNKPVRAYLWPTIDDVYRRVIFEVEGDGLWVTQTDYLKGLQPADYDGDPNDLPGPPAVAYRLGVPTPVLENVTSTFDGFEEYPNAQVRAWVQFKQGDTLLNEYAVTPTEVVKWGTYDFTLSGHQCAQWLYQNYGTEVWYTIDYSFLSNASDGDYWYGGGLLVHWSSVSVSYGSAYVPSPRDMLIRDGLMISASGRVQGKGHLAAGYATSGVIGKQRSKTLTTVSARVPSLPRYGAYRDLSGDGADWVPETVRSSFYLMKGGTATTSQNVSNYYTHSSSISGILAWLVNQGRHSVPGYAMTFRFQIYDANAGVLYETTRAISPDQASGKSFNYRLTTGNPVGVVTGNRAIIAVARNERDEESAPTEALTIETHAGEQLTLNAHVDNTSGFIPVTYIDFFASQEEGEDYLLIGSAPVDSNGNASMVYDTEAIGSRALQSTLWDTPPVNAACLTNCGNGFFACAVDNEIQFSEPYRPHAWPYNMLMPYKVIGMTAIEGGLLVTTTGGPSLVMGAHPANMSNPQLLFEQRGWSPTSMASLNGAAIFASKDGLVSVVGGVPSLKESMALFAREDWSRRYAWRGTFLRLQEHDGALIGVLDPEYQEGTTPPEGVDVNDLGNFMLRLDEAQGEYCRLDFDSPVYSLTTVDASDDMYIGTDTGIAVFGEGERLIKVWQRDFVFPKPVSFSACIVDVTEDEAAIEIIGDDTYSYSRALNGREQFRLPPTRPCLRWTIRFTGKGTIRYAELGASFAELQAA